MNRTVVLVGVVLTLPLVGVLFANLGNDPHTVDSPLIGEPAPDFALPSVETGEIVRLKDLRGRVVVVNFWATWCVPCFQEHEVLMDGVLRHPDVTFLGIVYQDGAELVKRFSAERGSAYPSLMDEQGRTAIAYGVYGVPETFFIAPDGTIVDKFVGALSQGALTGRVARARSGIRARSP